MGRRYAYTTTLAWGGDEPTAEIEVEVSFTVAWGSPESGRFGPPENYDPGSPDEVEDIRLEKVEGQPRPWGMGYGFIADDEFEADVVEKLEGSDWHVSAMIGEAAEREAGDHDEAMERRAEERRMGRF